MLNGQPHGRNSVLDVAARFIDFGERGVDLSGLKAARHCRFQGATGSRHIFARQMGARQHENRFDVCRLSGNCRVQFVSGFVE